MQPDELKASPVSLLFVEISNCWKCWSERSVILVISVFLAVDTRLRICGSDKDWPNPALLASQSLYAGSVFSSSELQDG